MSLTSFFGSHSPSNADRAEWARPALEAFQAQGGNDGDMLTDIGDLIVNLCHLARRETELKADDVSLFLSGKATIHNEEYQEALDEI